MSLIDRETLAVLRLPTMRAYVVSRACSAVGTNLLSAVILWQVYALTGSALQLGFVGLARFGPVIVLNLIAGAAADTYDRRRILLLSQGSMILASIVVFVATAANVVNLPLLYGLSVVAAAASAFEAPARQGLLQLLVPRSDYRGAILVNQTVFAIGSVTGPALAGLLIAVSGPSAAYGAYTSLLAVALVALLLIRVDSTELAARRGVSLAAVREGLSFILERRVLLGAMTLDMVAVIFGGAKALLPIYAVDILHAGASGYGLLASSAEVGSLLSALAQVALPKPKRAGAALLASILVYGLVTVAFGLSTSLPLAILFYAATGAADQVSVVMRHTAIQLSTPDELRGRVTSVNGIFTNSSVQLGAMESGFVAAATSTVFSVVSGGIAVIVIVAAVAWLLPELRSYRPETDTRKLASNSDKTSQTGSAAA